MNRIEMIWYSLLIIGATLMFTEFLFFTLRDMVKGHKKSAWMMGIFTSLCVVSLVIFMLVPIDHYDIFVALLCFILGLIQLCVIAGIVVEQMRDLQNLQKMKKY